MAATPATPARARILVLGRPGSGKGTQCTRLATILAVPHISTGDLLRATVARDTPLGRMLKGYLDTGELVPDDLVVDVVADHLADDPTNGFVLDGFPRTVAQAEQLVELLAPDELDLAIDLAVSPGVARARLLRRLVCGDCGRPTGPQSGETDAQCGECGGLLATRLDDEASTISRRLALHEELTEPLIAWLDAKGLLVRIDAEGPADEVAARAAAAVTRVAAAPA